MKLGICAFSRVADIWARLVQRKAVAIGCRTILGGLGGALLIGSLTACSVTGGGGGGSLTTSFRPTAGENYDMAQREFAGRDWEDAISYADFVRMRFPFSRHAVDAELLAARANFELKNYTAARDAFRQFSRMHPSHKHVRNGWSDYMAVVCSYMAVPPGTWPLPPDSQLDRSELDEAHEEVLGFFERYTGSPIEHYAQDLRERIEKRLLAHDLYVARYHLDRDHPDAAIVRLHAAHSRFPDSKSAADVLFLLGLTYLRMDEIELSRETFTELQSRHPERSQGRQAKYYLDYIYASFGPPDAKRKRPERPADTPESPVHLKPGTVRYAKTVSTPALIEQARVIERVRIEQEKAAREAALLEATARGSRSFTATPTKSSEAGSTAGSAPLPTSNAPSQPSAGTSVNAGGVSPNQSSGDSAASTSTATSGESAAPEPAAPPTPPESRSEPPKP